MSRMTRIRNSTFVDFAILPNGPNGPPYLCAFQGFPILSLRHRAVTSELFTLAFISVAQCIYNRMATETTHDVQSYETKLKPLPHQFTATHYEWERKECTMNIGIIMIAGSVVYYEKMLCFVCRLVQI